MILKEQTIVEIEGDSFEKYESKINIEKLSKLFGMLSNLYRNIYGSIIREYCSNAWDSHKDAGREDEPIYINLNVETDNNYLLIKDVGLGMSPKTMQTIYFNYLDSTKEESDDVIGAFGIGGKSALAYTHTFYIDTIFDNKLYHYIFTKQSSGIPAGELLYTEDIVAHNGTTIKIPIKNGDQALFFREFQKQLVYFPNVFIESNLYGYDNDYNIYENSLFKYRPSGSKKMLHISLGNVAYDIDWGELGIPQVVIPVALNFKIGELTPTPSRESIIYSKETIQIIKDKIEEVKTYFTNLHNKNVKEVNTIQEYLDNKSTGHSVDINLDSKTTINIFRKELPNLNTVVIKKLEGLIDSNSIVNVWDLDYQECNFKVGNTGFKREHYPSSSGLRYSHNSAMNSSTKYIITGELVHKKNLYIGSLLGYGETYFIKPAKKSLKKYIDNLGLKYKPKKDWRKIITLFQELSKEYVESKVPSYEALVLDPVWEANYDKQKQEALGDLFKRRKEERKIVYHHCTSGYNKSWVWTKEENTISKISKLAKNIIYVETNDRKKSIDLFGVFKSIGIGEKYWIVISTAKSFHKHFEKYDHMIEYNEFLKMNHPMMVQIATAKEIENRLNKIPSMLKNSFFEYINKDIYFATQELANYHSQYITTSWGEVSIMYSYIHRMVKDLNGLDQNIIDKMVEVENYFTDLEDLDNLIKHPKTFNQFKYITLLLRHHSKPINKYWYLRDKDNLLWVKLIKTEDD